MSPVVRHRLPPSAGAHSHTASQPYWQREKTIGRPVAFNALPILSYAAIINFIRAAGSFGACLYITSGMKLHRSYLR